MYTCIYFYIHIYTHPSYIYIYIYIYNTITPPDSHLSGATDLSGDTDTKVLCYEAASRKLCSFYTRGLRSVIGLDDVKVLANMSKDPEHTLECKFLVTGDQDNIDNLYSTSDNWDDICAHVKHSIQTGKYQGGDFSQADHDTGNTSKKLKDFHHHMMCIMYLSPEKEVLVKWPLLSTTVTMKLFWHNLRSFHLILIRRRSTSY